MTPLQIAAKVNKANGLPKAGYAVTARQVREVTKNARHGSSHPIEQAIIALLPQKARKPLKRQRPTRSATEPRKTRANANKP